MYDIATRTFQNAVDLLHLLRDEYSFPYSAPINVDQVAEMLGIRIEYEDMPNDEVGSIKFTDGSPVVTIDRFENSYEPRRRFTLAHEIGHYCLHSDQARQGFTDNRKTMSRTASYWDNFEFEANSFAAQLLMPKPLLVQEGVQIIGAYNEAHAPENGMPVDKFISKMASRFVVSQKAMTYRLKNLKLIE
ncbi:ImmA/IrrE family metallo-endopeptidase [Castellaniella denitrificans]|uniref:ImmA/IrrE family metallo-endopeptidase n=1 Tax=Castellaniella denitrificans TaxID=56119 RepID=A0ABT4M6W1_9BURK|nr:ImmA/IrrE family metallo-endopeptidase [Castellaniella denitrificans]MCZ4331067.1 ImmA/IrrE family metallo-endopeptidase [Castellaniella denitrificans]